MDDDKRSALEAAGWQLGDAEDFLGLTDEERERVRTRHLPYVGDDDDHYGTGPLAASPAEDEAMRLRYAWIDVPVFLLTIVLLVPLLFRLAEIVVEFIADHS